MKLQSPLLHVRALEALADPNCGWFYRCDASRFEVIPGSPIAYWASEALINAFRHFGRLNEIALPVEGIKTGDNDLHIRFWSEVSRSAEYLTHDDSGNRLWRKMCKGGEFRRWYGNNECICRWGQHGEELLRYKGSCVSNRDLIFTPAFNWTYISSGRFAARKAEFDTLYNNKGPSCYCGEDMVNTLLGVVNSSFAQLVFNITSPTLDYKPGGIGQTPVPISSIEAVDSLVEENINLCRSDWDNFEGSWDFRRHPLV